MNVFIGVLWPNGFLFLSMTNTLVANWSITANWYDIHFMKENVETKKYDNKITYILRSSVYVQGVLDFEQKLSCSGFHVDYISFIHKTNPEFSRNA